LGLWQFEIYTKYLVTEENTFMDNLDQLKKLAGIKEDIAEKFELHVFNIGNSRPFVSVGASHEITDELYDILNKDGWTKIEIHPIS
jgi:hypothetical protein